MSGYAMKPHTQPENYELLYVFINTYYIYAVICLFLLIPLHIY